MADFYNSKAVENGYTSINTEGSNYNALAYGLLLVNKNNRYGIVDLDFKEKVGTKYNSIKFNESSKVFIVSSGNRYGIIDEEGNIKVNLIYDEISVINYAPLLYKVKNDNKYGIMNAEGKIITNTFYDGIGYEADPTNAIEHTTVVIPTLSEEVQQSIVVKSDSGYGLIDAQTGKQIIECNLEKIYSILEDGEVMYEGVFKGQRVDLLQYIKAVNTVVVNM